MFYKITGAKYFTVYKGELELDYSLSVDQLEKTNFVQYSLMSGSEFLEGVKSKRFTALDGHLCQVFVDGCISNVGINSSDLVAGVLRLSPALFEKLCADHKVEVNWCNK